MSYVEHSKRMARLEARAARKRAVNRVLKALGDSGARPLLTHDLMEALTALSAAKAAEVEAVATLAASDAPRAWGWGCGKYEFDPEAMSYVWARNVDEACREACKYLLDDLPPGYENLPVTIAKLVVRCLDTDEEAEGFAEVSVAWQEDDDLEAQARLRAAVQPGGPDADAAVWLRRALAAGPRDPADLKREAAAVELGWRGVQRAARALGVKATGDGQGPFVWERADDCARESPIM